MFDPWWYKVSENDSRLHRLRRRHYSVSNLRPRKQRVGPGEKICLLTGECDAAFIWLHQKVGEVRDRTYCSLFRNEGGVRSSALILAAEQAVPPCWPREALTFVDPVAVNGDGKCFKVAGWRKTGRTNRGLIILEKTL